MTEAAAHKQPKALYMLFFAEMWERFSFYGMRALLVLYLTRQLFADLEDKDDVAYGIYAAYGALVYATPFIGGVVADRVLGYKKAVMLGSVLMAIGHFVMAIETEFFLYIALAFLIVGNGFFKPNISTMVGGLYGDNDPRRDGGFTIFYMGINLGAMLAPLLCGYLGETYGWFWGFTLAGFGMVAGLIVFGMGKGQLGENGDPPDLARLQEKVVGLSREHWVYVSSFASVAVFALLVRFHDGMSVGLRVFAGLVLLFLFVFSTRKEKEARQRLWVVIVLLFFNTLFWAFFEQAGSSISLFTDRNVDRALGFGLSMPTSAFQAVNPAFILAFAPLFSMLWIRLGDRDRDPSPPWKFVLGIAQLGLGFLVLAAAGSFATPGTMVSLVDGVEVSADAALVPVYFLLGGYLLHTTGELCLSPVGLSMVTKLSPKEVTSMVMGSWFLATALSHDFAGIIAKMTTAPGDASHPGALAMESGVITETAGMSDALLQSFDQLAAYTTVFHQIGIAALIAAAVLAVMSPLLKKWMHGVH